MVGTSISMQSSGLFTYPSMTICDGEHARVFAMERFFDTADDYFYGLSNGTANYTFDLTPDLTKMFIRLDMTLPNMTTFTLEPNDLDDRDK